MVRLLISLSSALVLWAGGAFAEPIATQVDPTQLPASKRSAGGRYLYATEAIAALQARPELLLIDIRTRTELEEDGLAAGTDAHIPWVMLEEIEVAGRKMLRPKDNDNFVADVRAALAKFGQNEQSPVVLICRSGNRTAEAATALSKAGFAEVYTIVDGFLGDKNPRTGQRDLNGWKLNGGPTTTADPALLDRRGK